MSCRKHKARSQAGPKSKKVGPKLNPGTNNHTTIHRLRHSIHTPHVVFGQHCVTVGLRGQMVPKLLLIS